MQGKRREGTGLNLSRVGTWRWPLLFGPFSSIFPVYSFNLFTLAYTFLNIQRRIAYQKKDKMRIINKSSKGWLIIVWKACTEPEYKYIISLKPLVQGFSGDPRGGFKYFLVLSYRTCRILHVDKNQIHIQNEGEKCRHRV